VDREALRALLEDLQAGRIGVEAAVQKLRGLPYEDLRFAKVDHHRALRGGAPEAVLCPGKSAAQVVAIVSRLAEHHANVLATRADPAVADAIAQAGLPHVYHADARLVVVRPEPGEGRGLIVVAAAGTADLPVAEESALVAEALGNRVERVYDCGVAGLHRLLVHYDLLAEANVIVAVAGMEGALPSVIGGLVDRPVIAVPTSIGYGASFGGIAALLAMLNSCAPGVSVVNIDNGYGAAHQASQINRLVAKLR
jgi:NCAIR mutase (PurE)-related protein